MANSMSPLIKQSITSADLIRDTKKQLNYDNLKFVITKRPETPLESSRNFFRSNSSDSLLFRASQINNGVKNCDPDSRPNSSSIRLTPLDTKRPISNTSEQRQPPRHPTKKSAHNKTLRHADLMIIGNKAGGSLQDVSNSGYSTSDNSYIEDSIIHSGPKESIKGSLIRSGTSDENFSEVYLQKDLYDLSLEENKSISRLSSSFLPSLDKTNSTITENKDLISKKPWCPNSNYIKNDKYQEEYVPVNKAVKKNMRSHNVINTDSAASITNRCNNNIGGNINHNKKNIQNRDANFKALPISEDRNEEIVMDFNVGIKDGVGEEYHNVGMDYFEQYIQPILVMFQTNKKASEEELEKLLHLLNKGNLLGHNCSKRKDILKILYMLLYVKDSVNFLRLTHIIFLFNVTGKNLVSVCDPLSKFCMKRDNDYLFENSSVIDDVYEIIRKTDPSNSSESFTCVFLLLASIKFLSSNTNIIKILANGSKLLVLKECLVLINNKIINSHDDYVKLFIQLGEILRNVINVNGMAREFLAIKILPEILHSLFVVPKEFDVVLLVSRIFSNLSTNHECCQIIFEEKCITKFLAALEMFNKKENLVLRLLYILSNIMSKIEQARIAFLKITNAYETIIKIFSMYHDKIINANEENKPGLKNAIDILSKCMSLLANLSLSEEVGYILSDHKECIFLLRSILANSHMDRDTYTEECIYTCLAALHNISFSEGSQNYLSSNNELVEDLIPFLTSNNQLILSDAIRLLANLTRSKDVRLYINHKNVIQNIIELLDSTDVEIVYACCGLLTNIMQDPELRNNLKKNCGIPKLISVLKDLGPLDWNMAAVVCQTLWNFSSDSKNICSMLGSVEAQNLMDILLEYLDEETILKNMNSEMKLFTSEIWRSEFCPVASELLLKIEGSISPLEVLR